MNKRYHFEFSTKPWFCWRSIPNPLELASIFNLVSKPGSKIFKMEANVIKVSNSSTASNWGFCKLKTASFFKGAQSGAVALAIFGMNLPR